MQKIIVSDTSCLILFYKIGQFELLHKVFGHVIITETVFQEFKRPIPKWIQVINPRTNLYLGLQGFLDPGEATSISLATEFKGSLLIIDESKGRKVAKELGVAITGSLGVLVTAKNRGIIDAVKPVIEKIKQTNFRLSDNLINKVFQYVNEE
ncbi:MAG: DUF3368 domain-containing protein [Anditalea sp.]